MSKKMYSKGKKHASSMIQVDRSAPSLLPRHVIEKDWGSMMSDHMGGYVLDLYEGVTKSMNQNTSDLKKCMNPKKI